MGSVIGLHHNLLVRPWVAPTENLHQSHSTGRHLRFMHTACLGHQCAATAHCAEISWFVQECKNWRASAIIIILLSSETVLGFFYICRVFISHIPQVGTFVSCARLVWGTSVPPQHTELRSADLFRKLLGWILSGIHCLFGDNNGIKICKVWKLALFSQYRCQKPR